MGALLPYLNYVWWTLMCQLLLVLLHSAHNFINRFEAILLTKTTVVFCPKFAGIIPTNVGHTIIFWQTYLEILGRYSVRGIPAWCKWWAYPVADVQNSLQPSVFHPNLKFTHLHLNNIQACKMGILDWQRWVDAKFDGERYCYFSNRMAEN